MTEILPPRITRKGTDLCPRDRTHQGLDLRERLGITPVPAPRLPLLTCTTLLSAASIISVPASAAVRAEGSVGPLAISATP